MKAAEVPVRVPRQLKRRLDRFCRDHGLRIGHVVAAALEDKIGELDEELLDIALAQKRLKDADYATRDEYQRYIRRRLKNR